MRDEMNLKKNGEWTQVSESESWWVGDRGGAVAVGIDGKVEMQGGGSGWVRVGVRVRVRLWGWVRVTEWEWGLEGGS